MTRAEKILKAWRFARMGIGVYSEKKNIDMHMGRLTASVHRGLNATDAAGRVLNDDVLPSDVRYAAGRAYDWAMPRATDLLNRRLAKKKAKK